MSLFSGGQRGDGLRSCARGAPHRTIVRILVAILFGCTAVLAFSLDIPQHGVLPGVALGQPFVYRVEVYLAAVYGGLLLVTPLYYGLVLGWLPTEISHRGARWPEGADTAFGELETAVRAIQQESTSQRARIARHEFLLGQVARGCDGG